MSQSEQRTMKDKQDENDPSLAICVSLILTLLSVLMFILTVKYPVSLFPGIGFISVSAMIWILYFGNKFRKFFLQNGFCCHTRNLSVRECNDRGINLNDNDIPSNIFGTHSKDEEKFYFSYELSNKELEFVLLTMMKELETILNEYNNIHTDEIRLANEIIKDYDLMDYESQRLKCWLLLFRDKIVPSAEELNDARHSIGVLQNNVAVWKSAASQCR